MSSIRAPLNPNLILRTEPASRRYCGVSSVVLAIFTAVAILALGFMIFSLNLIFKGEQFGRSSTAIHFLHLSDLHYDPRYKPEINRKCFCNDEPKNKDSKYSCSVNATNNEYGAYGCDSPKQLIQSALNAAAGFGTSVEPKIDFVLVTGDMIRHQSDELTKDEFMSAIDVVTGALDDAFEKTLPRIHLGLSMELGNNDGLLDYFFNVTDTEQVFNHELSDHLAPYFADEESKESFAQYGYYSQNFNGKVTIIALNTIIYSVKHVPKSTEIDDPLEQFDWLNQQLLNARQLDMPVYIVGHIPPGLDKFSFKSGWEEKYLLSYLKIITSFKDVIEMQFFGHYHKNGFIAQESIPPLIVTAAISPVFSNLPSFRIFEADAKSMEILDFKTYSTVFDVANNGAKTEPVWKNVFTASDAFDFTEVTTASLSTLAEKMITDDRLFSNFEFDRFGGRVPGSIPGMSCVDDHCRRQIVCGSLYYTSQDFEACMKSE